MFNGQPEQECFNKAGPRNAVCIFVLTFWTWHCFSRGAFSGLHFSVFKCLIKVYAVHERLQDLNVIVMQNSSLTFKVKNTAHLQLSMIGAKQAN